MLEEKFMLLADVTFKKIAKAKNYLKQYDLLMQ